METSTVEKVSYSLKERFWLIGPEQRIRRWQYFARIFAPGFTLMTLFFLVSFVITLVSPFLLLSPVYIVSVAVFGILFTILFYKISLILVTKRCYDFGNDGKIARGLVHTNFVLTIASAVIGIIALFGLAKGIDMIPDVIFTTLDFISSIVGIAFLILVLFLLFRPGNPGDNQYGVNPINTKIGFFG